MAQDNVLTETAHANPYANAAQNCPGATEGVNPFEESAVPAIGESWVEEINLQSTDRGFGRGEGYEPNDAATGSFP